MILFGDSEENSDDIPSLFFLPSIVLWTVLVTMKRLRADFSPSAEFYEDPEVPRYQQGPLVPIHFHQESTQLDWRLADGAVNPQGKGLTFRHLGKILL